MKTPPNQTASESAPSKRNFNLTAPLFPELEPPVVAASWPNPNTRDGEALAALLVAPQNQADYWSSWRLGASIKSLQYKGWEFIKRNIIKPGCRKAIAEYELDRTAPSVKAALAFRGSEGQ